MKKFEHKIICKKSISWSTLRIHHFKRNGHLIQGMDNKLEEAKGGREKYNTEMRVNEINYAKVEMQTFVEL